VPFYPRVAKYLWALERLYTGEVERAELAMLAKLAREVDWAYGPQRAGVLQAFLRALRAFRDYWGAKPEAVRLFEAIEREAEEFRFVELGVWGGGRGLAG